MAGSAYRECPDRGMPRLCRRLAARGGHFIPMGAHHRTPLSRRGRSEPTQAGRDERRSSRLASALVSTVEVHRAQLSQLEMPLLGSAGNATVAELALAARFDQLHQLLYVRGGIRPTNAAIEEVGKLLLLRLWLDRQPDAAVEGVALADLFAGIVPDASVVEVTKQAFVRVLREPEMAVHGLDGSQRSLWPMDEPFRLAEPVVLQAALAIADEVLSDGARVADPLGTAFDAFLSGRYDHSGGLGTFLTPSSVARMMAEIVLQLLPSDAFRRVRGPVIADPFCGTGRFLVAAFDAVEERSVEADLVGLLNGGLVGADQSTSAISKSGLNLLLYGARQPSVFTVADSMTDSGLDALRGKLWAVLTNPPFGGGKYADEEGIARTRELFPNLRRGGSIDPALAGLARSLHLLRPDGVLGIVLPEGIVNGRQFEELLQDSDYHVVASVSLPTVTFALSGTVAKTSAVFIRKSPRGGRTVLARVEHVGFQKQAGKSVADPEGSEIPSATTHVLLALTAEGADGDVRTFSERPLVASVPTDGLTSVDPARLDPAAVSSRHRLVAAGGVRLGELLSATKRGRAHRAPGDPFISVLHVDALGTVDWGEAYRYEPITPGQQVAAGDVLVSLLNPSKLRAAVVPSSVPGAEASTEFGVFRTEYNPYAILGLLYMPDVKAQLRPLGSGTSSSRRRITPADVLDLIVPALDRVQLDELGARVERLVRTLETSRLTLDGLYRDED